MPSWCGHKTGRGGRPYRARSPLRRGRGTSPWPVPAGALLGAGSGSIHCGGERLAAMASLGAPTSTRPSAPGHTVQAHRSARTPSPSLSAPANGGQGARRLRSQSGSQARAVAPYTHAVVRGWCSSRRWPRSSRRRARNEGRFSGSPACGRSNTARCTRGGGGDHEGGGVKSPEPEILRVASRGSLKTYWRAEARLRDAAELCGMVHYRR
jgi:hypothetical protein